MRRQKTRYDRIISRINNNPVAATVIVLGTIVIALATFTGAMRNLINLIPKKRTEIARMKLSQMSLDYTPEAFLRSAKMNDIVAVKLFLAAGINPNVTDEKGNTALMFEAAKGRTAILDVLLKANTDVNKKGEEGGTALSWAAKCGKTDSLRILLDKGADAEAINSAFIDAAGHGQLEVLRILLDKGVEVDKVGSHALCNAAGMLILGMTEEKVNDTVSFLLDIGVHANEKSKDGLTALLIATQKGRISVVQTLLDRGAEVNTVCDCRGTLSGGCTALMVAVYGGHTEIVRALLEKGADVNAQGTFERRTVLMMALLGIGVNGYRKSVEVVGVLLEYGADINMQDGSGKTAIQLAQEELKGERRAEIIRLLKQSGPQ